MSICPVFILAVWFNLNCLFHIVRQLQMGGQLDGEVGIFEEGCSYGTGEEHRVC